MGELSEQNRALIERLRKTLAISPNTAELLIAAWAQTNAILDAARAEGVAAPATGSEREALVVMLSEAVRFASWAAGEGICPVEGQPARAPEDFLMEYSDATGEEEWETMADRLPIILALAASKAGDRGVLAGVEKALKHALAHNLKFKQTGKDPKSDGYAYAEVPDWTLRQWLNRVEIAQRGVVIQGSTGQEIAAPADGALGRQALSVQADPISLTKPTDTQTAGGEQT